MVLKKITEQRRLELAKIIIALCWLIIIIYVLIANVPDSPLKPSFRQKLNLIAILPEGWGFFTRDPREQANYLYQKNDIEWEPIQTLNSASTNFFGIKRKTRAQGVELAMLIRKIPKNKWIRFDEPLQKFWASDTLDAFEVNNDVLIKSLCGQLLVVKREPVPWAWSRHAAKINMPAEIVKLQINCDDK